MTHQEMQQNAWELLSCACKACKLLLWLRDEDSPQRLTPQLREPMQQALRTVVRFPNAVAALEKKMRAIYDIALRKPLVGVGASPFSGRLGKRTAEVGLLAALDFAREHQAEFQAQAETVCRATNTDWTELFALAEQFIDRLDWGEFVIENSRGQASCLVLECVELLEAVTGGDPDKISEELGDVFYNYMAFCLSLRIQSKHVH
jgi:NTP pyrophosphatase (non-canonical NTP hydrolase)